MKWYNPFSYFSAENDIVPAVPLEEEKEGNSVGALIVLAIVAACVFWFYTNCRVVGQRMGNNGKMEPIYDCTASKQVMYAQPQQMVYAQPQQVMYAQPQQMVYAQPPIVQSGGIFGFGRRR